jgi:hypothetical protein
MDELKKIVKRLTFSNRGSNINKSNFLALELSGELNGLLQG